MKKILFFAFLIGFSSIFAQKPYFQQEVNTKINVTLDDKKHSLKGDIAIEYTNNSPDALTEIFMHLWGNAFKNQRSVYAKQELENGSTRFYHAKEKDLGFYSELDFAINNQKATWEFDKKNPDIAIIKLSSPLKSGEKLTISTPFSLKIPASFSRLGHVEDSYQMTQWYPKPAVYDAKGWHAMPYLDQGEFYSEFGSFDVTISLPENYVVGATGICQQATEYAFLQRKVTETEEQAKKGFTKELAFPPSSEKIKTLQYKAENVHDFAWFADKRFWVLKKEQTLASGKKVDCWAMFTNEDAKYWTKGADYVARAVDFYSNNVGEYPYPHATAVQSALSAGGGMEYPMITVIGNTSSEKDLDIVITHEVGHNWFYGILASNERDHGWMDEGMNTYYENRYTDTYWKKSDKKTLKIGVSNDDLANIGMDYIGQQLKTQAPETHSADFTSINYGLCMYSKTGKSMAALAEFVGQENYDKTMKAYYEKWKFKHPYPEDFRKHWEQSTDKNVAWFFDDLINTNHMHDIRFKPLKNKNDLNYDLKLDISAKNSTLPVPISALKDGKIVTTKVFEKPAGQDRFTVDFPKGDYDELRIDAQNRLPILRRQMGVIAPTGKYLKGYTTPNFKLLNLVSDNKRPNTLGILPMMAFNYYDKAQIGALIYTAPVPNSGLSHFEILPLYSFKTNKFNGLMNHHWKFPLKNDKIESITYTGNARLFSMDRNTDYDYYDRYARASAGFDFNLRKSKPTASKSQMIGVRLVAVENYYHNNINFKDKIFRDTSSNYAIGELKFTHKNDYVLSPSELTITMQAGKGFSKIFTNFNKKILFERKREAIYLHLFGGKFLNYGNPNAFVNFQANGKAGLSVFQRDYMYDNFLLGRNVRQPRYYYPPVGNRDTLEGGNWRSQQIFMQDAGMRTVANVGSSNNWMVGGGIAYNMPFPMKLGIRPYFDYVMYPEKNATKTTIKHAWTAGLGLIVVPDIFEIYLPIPIKNSEGWTTLNSDNLFFEKREKYYQRIAFMLNINKLSPYKLIEKVKI